MGFDGYTWETADPARSFFWDELGIREEPGGSLKDQSGTPERQEKEQLGA
jgi:hypothetical protein